MSPHDRLLLLIDNLRGNREFRLVDADLSALIDIDARITWLEAENARLRGELEEIEIRARMAQGWDDNLADEVRAYMLCDIMRHIEQYARAALQEGSDD